ncbi:MAG: dipeptidase [Gammaproteobacteria bacterium]|nr:dipeptidase [Gammaproteobacteria bacterium]
MSTSGIVWDNHACLPFIDTEQWLPGIGRYRKAGIDAVTVNIGDSHVPLEVLIRTAASIRHYVQQHPDQYVLGLTTGAIRSAKATGRLAVCLDVEGVYALGEQLSLVEFLYQIGVRWMLMVYNRRNLAGSGCHDPDDEGLTELGRAMLREMDRVGMIKCCSHTGYRTAREILDSSDRPVIFSHSNPRRLRDHPRNIPDELIKACAATGGVVGINGVGLFLGDGDPTADAVVRNIDYVAQLAGAEHVGLGLDYMFKGSGVEEPGRKSRELWPAEWGYRAGMGFLGPEAVPEIAEGLTRLGYKPAAISGILGENLMRVAETVWRP